MTGGKTMLPMSKAQKALLLIRDDALAFKIKTALEELGWVSEDLTGDPEHCEIVFVDRTFHEDRPVFYLKEERIKNKIVFFTISESEFFEILKNRTPLQGDMNDILVVRNAEPGLPQAFISAVCGETSLYALIQNHLARRKDKHARSWAGTRASRRNQHAA
jgi:hypothetical protein